MRPAQGGSFAMPAAMLALLVAIAGCGRIGYDSVLISDDGDATVGRDGADGDGTAPDGAELVPDGASPDGPLVCPAVCTLGCEGGVCNILGDTLDSTGTAIVCPSGMPCHVVCGQRQACRTRIDCTQATGSCTVECSGDRSCFFGALCGAAPCSVDCIGVNSCGPVECGTTSSCTVACTGDNSCQFGVTCCGAATSCDVSCGGSGSCMGPVRCDGDPDCNTACS